MASPDRTMNRSEGEPKPAMPSISLPKGGGAIRGIGEKFAANPVNGTGSMSVPLAASPGRSGFGPALSLSYDSGSGNGPFGFGWTLSTPAISRKTDKGLPQYRDAEESDVYLLSGAEDLVPVYRQDEAGEILRDLQGKPLFDEREQDAYRVRRYRPRIEGLFARIERWTRQDGDIHWRSISRDNVLTVYGKDPNARIADPVEPGRIFTWLICETRDDKGNAAVYEYKPEDGTGVDRTRAHERNRGGLDDLRRRANRYLKHIRYGNRVPLLDGSGQRPLLLTPAQIESAGWMFEVVFDYGEHDAEAPKPKDPGPWTFRGDPFSSYRAGFEVRTSRLCQRVLMFHHFAGEPDVGADCLVRSTDFTYSHEQNPADVKNPVYTFLKAVTQNGYRRSGGGYLKRGLPPVEFEYSQPIVQDTVEDVDPASLENLPIGLDGSAYQWTDLHGEGIPGLFAEQAGAWFYKRNVSPVSEGPVEFAPVEVVAARPNLEMAGGRAQLMDLAGDGQPDLVVLDGPMPGLYEHDGGEGWKPFRPFSSRLGRDLRDPNLKLVDLDGDGHADVLISEDDAFVWHASLAEEGFGPARRVAQALDEEKGPRLAFADSTESIHLADLSGDGLTDLVRIRNGEVCYWPNLGYGRFGAKVTMDNAPWFDHPDQFDPKRLRLADVDGTGTTDILYLHRDGVRLYFNQSGNGWSTPQILRVFPRVDDLVSITPVDLRGNGTACLVWSSPLPGDARRQMRLVDLMGGMKPHLLIRMINNLGAETRVEYASSTKFYLRDRLDGRPWITRLPFPVHVVERVVTSDLVSGNRFTTLYAYHYGYFDGEEREFRGFGRVEQWDTEEFGTLADGLPEATNVEAASHVPPVHTKTWFHTGVYVRQQEVSRHLAHEYFGAPQAAAAFEAWEKEHLLADTVFPGGDLSAGEERQAVRALKGAMLRQEVYALDGTDKAGIPYTVAEQNFTIRRVQPQEGNRHAVFFTQPREALKSNYERNPADPRISHALTLEVDPYGNVLKEVVIGYGRRPALVDPALSEEDKTRQTRPLITYTENSLANAAPSVDHHRTPLPAETRTYELTGFEPEDGVRFRFDEWTENGMALLAAAVEIPYQQAASHVTKQKRLIEHVRTLYRKDDLTAFSPLGVVEPMALPGESYKLAFTPGLLAQVFKRKRTGQPDEDLLPNPAPLLEGKGGDQGGYIAMDGNWWIPGGRAFFDLGANAANPAATAAQERSTAQQHFYLPRKLVDIFGQSLEVGHDAHDLLLSSTRDALGNTVSAVNDYRVLQPRLVTDPNRNRTAAGFDALGLVVATAVMGKEGQNAGDLLEDFDADPPLADLQAFLADPRARAASLLGKATSRIVYDLGRFARAGQPAYAATLARETHFHDPGGAETRIQVSISYSDGFEREIQKKLRAEPGEAGTPGRWVGSGRTVFNNKGKPVRQYQPFFSATPLYEPESEMTDTGVSPVLFYDPVGRVVATLFPHHVYEKTVFAAWQQTVYDVNDTVAARGAEIGDPRTDPDIAGIVRGYFETEPAGWQTWHAQRIGLPAGDPERDAAQKTAVHANTPTVSYLDVLGRPFLTVAHNRFERDGTVSEEKHASRVELDVEGNQRAVFDAEGRVVMRYDYDLLGNRIHQASQEAGERWMLGDAAGNAIRAWDSRGHRFRTAHDLLRRPTDSFVQAGAGPELQVGRTVYGETLADPEAANLRGRMARLFDQAGVLTSREYDFKGNLLRTERQLAQGYNVTLDWSAAVPPALEAPIYAGRTRYDALDRPIQQIAPHSDQPGARINVIQPVYNEANLLEEVHAWLDRSAEPAGLLDPATANLHAVTGIDYDAKGQRRQIDYGNGVTTTYSYDPLTFRLVRLLTRRDPVTFPADCPQPQPADWPGCQVQNLEYTYDPTGNVTQIRDRAQQAVFFRNRRVEPSAGYTYDALYRLIEATGREHLGQAGASPSPWSYNDRARVGILFSGSDGNAMGRYLERYVYDFAGNLEEMSHRGSDPANLGWTRTYAYAEPSLLEPGKASNRLTRTTVGALTETYSVAGDGYDAHGNLLRMPHLEILQWDFKDQLRMTRRQAIDAADSEGVEHQGERTWYVYDSGGLRVRKVTELASGQVKDERIDLGGFEIYRRPGPNPVVRETLHILDDQQRIALVETRTAGSDPAPAQIVRYQLGNHLGSVSLELDGQALLLSYEEYTPYGSTSFQAVRSPNESLKRYRYSGKERDEESGLAYHVARYYMPWLGRWVSADPIGIADGPNLYVYCKCNPVLLVDRAGTDARLSVDQTTSTITYSSTVHIYGTTEELARFRPAAARAQAFYRDSSGAVTIDGRQWTVRYAVSFEFHDTTVSPLPTGLATIYNQMTDPAIVGSTQIPGTRGILRDVPGLRTLYSDAHARSFASGTAQVPGFRAGDSVLSFSSRISSLGSTFRILPSFLPTLRTFPQPTSKALMALNPALNATEEELFRGIIHEVGHTLGFDERYTEVPGGAQSHLGFEGDFMAARDLSLAVSMHPGHREASARFALYVSNGRDVRSAALRDFRVDSTAGGTEPELQPGALPGRPPVRRSEYETLQSTLRTEVWSRFRQQLAPPPPPPRIQFFPRTAPPPGAPPRQGLEILRF